MAKQQWKPGNMLYPLPAVMVSVRDNEGKDNIITVAWAGTVLYQPADGIHFGAWVSKFRRNVFRVSSVC